MEMELPIQTFDTEGDDVQISSKMNPSLAKQVGLFSDLHTANSEYPTYSPPKEPGLNNSQIIIPKYYCLAKHPSKIPDIDYYEIIKDDIRNFRKLNTYQIEYIKQLSHADKDELLELYN